MTYSGWVLHVSYPPSDRDVFIDGDGVDELAITEPWYGPYMGRVGLFDLE